MPKYQSKRDIPKKLISVRKHHKKWDYKSIRRFGGKTYKVVEVIPKTWSDAKTIAKGNKYFYKNKGYNVRVVERKDIFIIYIRKKKK